MGGTGTGPQAPKLTLTVDPILPEGQTTIPVTVTATVEPSALSERTLSVQLKLLGQKTPDPETNAEFSTNTLTVTNPDVSWDVARLRGSSVEHRKVDFRFASNLSAEETIYLTTGSGYRCPGRELQDHDHVGWLRLTSVQQGCGSR